MEDLFTIKEASKWASEFLGKKVTNSNITYLINYGRIKKFGNNGIILISKSELENYYLSYNGHREISWKDKLGDDLNWALSFDQFKEAETTKHVHRLHPYKGKFIPQLVEYFLDANTDSYKKNFYFKKGDIVLDPFAGSGTALVQANELGIHAVGIDISTFNSLITNTKVHDFNLTQVQLEINEITKALRSFLSESVVIIFDKDLTQKLNDFNNLHFPEPDYKYKIQRGEIDEKKYSEERSKLFTPIFRNLVKQYGVKLMQEKSNSFLDKWYSEPIREEIEFVFQKISDIQNTDIKNLLSIILSRTIRSCRATTHSDLATLIDPIMETYYCKKHGKVCKPVFSILPRWNTYTKDTVKRLLEFNRLRTQTFQLCLTGDSRNIDIYNELKASNSQLASLVKTQKIKGIFSSPPYVGLIDYHEQHAYAYDLFKFERKDDLEIGPLYKGQGKVAKQSYIEGISEVLIHCKKFLVKDYDIFLVANDKYNIYPTIAENSGMRIVNQFKRPVLNRTEKDKNAYSETIFHLKAK
jgi:hypothetical protein